MIYVGIDPGLTGGMAIIRWVDPSGWSTFLYPFSTHGTGDLKDILVDQHALTHRQHLILVEKSGLHPKNGKQSYYQSGRNLGILEGLLTALSLTYELISPTRWQNALDCKTRGNKKISRAKAHSLFPGINGITHLTADALLIAHYAREFYK